ncbi:P-type conjugative transfer protein VirB9 [Candidatus Jidaibacter acanthamoebae]|nr:P-type conjugative transfer protein VirB9 [Candidatus Jidaibacter acanthamoeba]
MKIIRLFLLFSLCLSMLTAQANATSTPRPIGNEKRIKIINYMPNTVFKFVGHYFYQSIIEFGLDEEIDTITMGTPTPWQIVPAGNRIFIKPVEDDATTNMTVITNKRMYFFEMHAQDAKSISDDELSFVVKFVYPEDGTIGGIKQVSSTGGPDLSKPELYNFKYTISGDARLIEPLLIFDDGEFTYFKFRNINAEIPAFFLVDDKGNEGLINYRVSGEYVVIERVAPKFTLRHGVDTLCVFNELMEADLKKR